MMGRGFYYPVGVGIAPNGRLYVLGRSHEGDTRGVQICMTDHDEGYYGVFGSIGEDDGQFTWTSAIVVDGKGLVYVSDEYLNRISIFDESGTFLRKWGVPGAGEGELDGPSGIALDADQNLWIVDHRNARLQRFTREGRFLSGFGAGGSGDGQMKLPWGVTVAPGGDLYVADWGNDRVLRFTPDGEYVTSYGSSGSGDGQLLRPSSVAVDEAGCVYVADWGNNRVQVFDPEGGFVCAVMGEATLSAWAKGYLDSNVEEREARDRSEHGARCPNSGRRCAGRALPRGEEVLGPRLGEARRRWPAARHRPQPPPHPGLPASLKIGPSPSARQAVQPTGRRTR